MEESLYIGLPCREMIVSSYEHASSPIITCPRNELYHEL